MSFCVLIHESNGFIRALVCSAERFFEILPAPYSENKLIFSGVITVVEKIVVHPVRPNVFFEIFEVGGVDLTVLPHKGKFHQIRIFRIEIAVVQRKSKTASLDRLGLVV